MADGDVIADAEAPAQEIVASEAQVEAVATDLTPDAALDDGADATDPGADDTPQSLETLFERYPHLREQDETRLRERENAGANRREAQLKREAGKKEITTRNVQRFLEAKGVEVDDPAQLHYFFDLALANSAQELLANVPDALFGEFTVPVAVREQAVDAREAGDLPGYLRTLVNGTVAAEVAKARADDEKRIATEVNRRLAAEVKARGLEAAPRREGALRAPSTDGPRGISAAELEAMPSEVFRSKPIEEQQRLINEARQNAARQTVGAR